VPHGLQKKRRAPTLGWCCTVVYRSRPRASCAKDSSVASSNASRLTALAVGTYVYERIYGERSSDVSTSGTSSFRNLKEHERLRRGDGVNQGYTDTGSGGLVTIRLAQGIGLADAYGTTRDLRPTGEGIAGIE
jgi:hypothetical protein